MLKIHSRLRAEIAQKKGITEFSASGEALALGAERFKRIILRALDYLPPGEVSFNDYGRAIIAADQASHPEDGQERDWIVEEFIRRKIALNAAALRVKTNYAAKVLAKVNLETLAESDWAAYEFANRNRKFLNIPPGIPFRVRPRLDVTKRYYHPEGKRLVRECLFKVSWDRKETNQLGHSFPHERQVTVGTTLAIDWETRTVRAKLTSDLGVDQRDDRDRMLSRLVSEDLIRVGDEAVGPDGQPLFSVLRAESMDGLIRIRGTARILHILGGVS